MNSRGGGIWTMPNVACTCVMIVVWEKFDVTCFKALCQDEQLVETSQSRFVLTSKRKLYLPCISTRTNHLWDLL